MSVVAVLAKQPSDRQRHFVDFKLRAVFKLLTEIIFPLCTLDKREPTIFKTLRPIVALWVISRVKATHSAVMHLREFVSRGHYLRFQ